MFVGQRGIARPTRPRRRAFHQISPRARGESIESVDNSQSSRRIILIINALVDISRSIESLSSSRAPRPLLESKERGSNQQMPNYYGLAMYNERKSCSSAVNPPRAMDNVGGLCESSRYSRQGLSMLTSFLHKSTENIESSP